MSLLEAVILGIIQGLTEFLPVSSSGHLELAKAILGDETLPAESLQFTVILHAGTALATVVAMRDEVARIFKGLFRLQWNEEARFSVKVIISMFPAALVGLFFMDFIESFFGGRVAFVGAMLLVTALLLFIAERAVGRNRPIGFANSFVIGVAQAIAILPGISRSGATIATALMMGVDRDKAARFSFLMVVPLILGKMSKDLIEGSSAPSESSAAVLVTGFIVAFIVGYAACRWMIALVRKAKLLWFSLYCLLAGLVALALGM